MLQLRLLWISYAHFLKILLYGLNINSNMLYVGHGLEKMLTYRLGDVEVKKIF